MMHVSKVFHYFEPLVLSYALLQFCRIGLWLNLRISLSIQEWLRSLLCTEKECQNWLEKEDGEEKSATIVWWLQLKWKFTKNWSPNRFRIEKWRIERVCFSSECRDDLCLVSVFSRFFFEVLMQVLTIERKTWLKSEIGPVRDRYSSHTRHSCGPELREDPFRGCIIREECHWAWHPDFIFDQIWICHAVFTVAFWDNIHFPDTCLECLCLQRIKTRRR